MRQLLRKFTLVLCLCIGALGVLLSQEVDRSVLADGEIYRFSVRESGIHKIDRAFLESIEINPSLVSTNKIQLFGHPGGRLPQANNASRPVDLVEMSISIADGGDGQLDGNDYILFYAEGPNNVDYIEAEQRFHTKVNPYSETAYYFLKIGTEDGQRIEGADQPTSASYQTAAFDDFQHYEVESQNLLHAAGNANLQGSGQRWLGDYFRGNRTQSFTGAFDLRDGIDGSSAMVHLEFAARSSIASNVVLNVGDLRFTKSISRALVSNIEEDYARFGTIKEEFDWSQSYNQIVVDYPDRGNNNEGWLDFIALKLRRKLVYRGDQLSFSDTEAWNVPEAEYEIEGLDAAEIVWDITDPMHPKSMAVEGTRFFHRSSPLSRFILADGSNYLVPDGGGGKIPNQDLHGIQDLDYLIIHHEDFTAAAQKLAEHRTNYSGHRVFTVTVDQVYNEFSAGKVDPTAIRDFARMLYRRTPTFRYLTLIGDGSFDYKHVYTTLSDESFLPVFETEQSMDPIFAFPSDDYYALLDDAEGVNLRGALDIAVGRLPVRTSDEANLVVNKIISYETDPEMLGSWRTSVLFVADDEDGGRHLDAADAISKSVASQFPYLNIGKVYMDAFAEEKTPGGAFNFNATNALTQEIFQGKLLVNYIGHGGSNGWAQERLLQHADIDKWQNGGKLPLLITATCSFAGYDNPKKITAGEYSLTLPNGGSVALFSTVRAVYAGSNERLTRSVFNEVFKTDGSLPLPIGEILVNAKNANSADTLGGNARKFTLLGDPAMRLAIPRLQVKTTSINGKEVNTARSDTIKALSKVTVTGEILDMEGNLVSSYSGQIFPTIYDKETILKTLGQDGSPERDFELQQNVIFNGRASVNQGRFNFTFVMPKDINYVYGNGKISYYAQDGSLVDAQGNFNDFIVGGTAENEINDNEGPVIQLYLNDESFVHGGVTDPNPTLYVKLSDENGINVTGNGIGHDLTSILDNDRQNLTVLNDFYEASLDDYTSGVASYPLTNLAPGTHTVSVKAWDILNNSSEMQLEFVVADKSESAIRRVYNYPNPFNDNTCFQFEHNFINQDIDLRVEIYTVKGQLIKTLFQSLKPSSSLSRDLKWDGRDDFGSPLASGIYVYRIRVNRIGSNGFLESTSSDLQKLVILR